MDQDVQSIFTIMCRFGELVVHVGIGVAEYVRSGDQRALARMEAGERRDAAAARRAANYISRHASGRASAEKMRSLYGQDKLDYFRIPPETAERFAELAREMKLPPYALRQTETRDGDPSWVIVTYCEDYENAFAMILEEVKGEFISDERAAELGRGGYDLAADTQLDRCAGASPGKSETLTFYTGRLSADSVGNLRRSLNEAGLSCVFTDETGVHTGDYAKDTYVTFSGEDAAKAADVLRKTGVVFEETPERFQIPVSCREDPRRVQSRTSSEKTGAEHTLTSEENVGHCVLTNLPSEQAADVRTRLGNADIDCVVADFGGGQLADVLIADDCLERARNILPLEDINRDFKDVDEVQMRHSWLPHYGPQCARLDANAARRKRAAHKRAQSAGERLPAALPRDSANPDPGRRRASGHARAGDSR